MKKEFLKAEVLACLRAIEAETMRSCSEALVATALALREEPDFFRREAIFRHALEAARCKALDAALANFDPELGAVARAAYLSLMSGERPH